MVTGAEVRYFSLPLSKKLKVIISFISIFFLRLALPCSSMRDTLTHLMEISHNFRDSWDRSYPDRGLPSSSVVDLVCPFRPII